MKLPDHTVRFFSILSFRYKNNQIFLSEYMPVLTLFSHEKQSFC